MQTHFRQSFESWVAGLRPVCFLVTFCTTQKVTTRSLSGKFRGLANLESAHRSDSLAPQRLKPFLRELPRFCKPRCSSPQWQLRTVTIKTFPKGSFEVLQTSNQRTTQQLRTIQLNPFAAPRLLPAAMPPFLLPAATDRRPWRLFFPPYGGLRRTKTCHRQLFARPSNIFFCRLRGRIATPFKAAP